MVQALKAQPTKPRLCVNGGPWNPCFAAPKPGMEGFGQLPGQVGPDGYLAGFDHKS